MGTMQMIYGHADDNSQEMVPTNRTRNYHLVDTTFGIVHASVPMSKEVYDPPKSLGQHQTSIECDIQGVRQTLQ